MCLLFLEGSLEGREIHYELAPVRSLSIRGSKVGKCNGLADCLLMPLLVYHKIGGLSALKRRSGLFLGRGCPSLSTKRNYLVGEIFDNCNSFLHGVSGVLRNWDGNLREV